MEFQFTDEIIEWRGPAPHLFVPLPPHESAELRDQPELSYGWGCIPVVGRIGETTFETALIPKDGRYLLPLKVALRRAEGLDLGDVVTAHLTVGGPQR